MKKFRILQKLRSGSGTLFLVGGLLLGSAAIRIFLGAESALAMESDEMGMAMDGDVDHMMAECETPEDITAVLKLLQTRQSEIEAREAALMDRLVALDLAEQEIEENFVALQNAEQALSATMARAATASEDDLANLTSVYENMKAKEAAALFEEMDPEFAAGFLGRMRADAAAAIMTGLTSGKAYSISVILAGRNANAPKQ